MERERMKVYLQEADAMPPTGTIIATGRSGSTQTTGRAAAIEVLLRAVMDEYLKPRWTGYLLQVRRSNPPLIAGAACPQGEETYRNKHSDASLAIMSTRLFM